MYACPKGHTSTESDFCSECGAKITGAGIAEAPTVVPEIEIPGALEHCPECSTPHEADSGSFCEICGYNFMTGDKGGDPLSVFPPPINMPSRTATMPTQRPPTRPISQITTPPQTAHRWQAIVSIDPSLAAPDSPTPPAQAPITIDLNHPTNLIGRTSQARAIYPEIPLDLDDAVSSRHAILTVRPDGKPILRDIGSSNGTMVNGTEIAIMADIPISSGDEITLGHWTRIKIQNLI